MNISRIIMNTDKTNKYNYRFTVKALEDAYNRTFLKGNPLLLNHDFTKLIGWSMPIGILITPNLSITLGENYLCETKEEFNNLANHYKNIEKQKENNLSEKYKSIFFQDFSEHISDKFRIVNNSCISILDTFIAKKAFPNIFEKKDKNNLIYLKDLLNNFEYIGQGKFKLKNANWIIFAHKFFRRSLSNKNNFNYFFLDELLNCYGNNKLNVRLALDENMIGYHPTSKLVSELEYWRGPKFNIEIDKIRTGVTVYKANELDEYYYGLDRTEFWWKNNKKENKLEFEVEEILLQPNKSISNDKYSCKYIHTIYDFENNSLEHFDGAIKIYDEIKMLERNDTDISHAKKNSDYNKLFRIDGEISIDQWKNLVIHYYKDNYNIREYFGEEINEKTFSESSKSFEKNEFLSTLDIIPHKIEDNEGFRVFISYSKINTKYIGIDKEIIVLDKWTFEDDIYVMNFHAIEFIKILKNYSENIEIPQNVKFIKFDDSILDLPIIHHGKINLKTKMKKTFDALISIINNTEMEFKFISFTLAWIIENKEVRMSFYGNTLNIQDFLVKYRDEFPLQNYKIGLFLDKLSEELNQFNYSGFDYSTIQNSGVLQIKRIAVNPDWYKYRYTNNGVEYLLKIPDEEIDIFEQLQSRIIKPSSAFLIENAQCDLCHENYITCNHSKYLDKNITVSIKQADEPFLFWSKT